MRSPGRRGRTVAPSASSSVGRRSSPRGIALVSAFTSAPPWFRVSSWWSARSRTSSTACQRAGPSSRPVMSVPQIGLHVRVAGGVGPGLPDQPGRAGDVSVPPSRPRQRHGRQDGKVAEQVGVRADVLGDRDHVVAGRLTAERQMSASPSWTRSRVNGRAGWTRGTTWPAGVKRRVRSRSSSGRSGWPSGITVRASASSSPSSVSCVELGVVGGVQQVKGLPGGEPAERRLGQVALLQTRSAWRPGGRRGTGAASSSLLMASRSRVSQAPARSPSASVRPSLRTIAALLTPLTSAADCLSCSGLRKVRAAGSAAGRAGGA